MSSNPQPAEAERGSWGNTGLPSDSMGRAGWWVAGPWSQVPGVCPRLSALSRSCVLSPLGQGPLPGFPSKMVWRSIPGGSLLRTLIKAQVGQEEARARVICPSLWKRKQVPSVQIKHLYKKRERSSEGTALKPPGPPHLGPISPASPGGSLQGRDRQWFPEWSSSQCQPCCYYIPAVNNPIHQGKGKRDYFPTHELSSWLSHPSIHWQIWSHVLYYLHLLGETAALPSRGCAGHLPPDGSACSGLSPPRPSTQPPAPRSRCRLWLVRPCSGATGCLTLCGQRLRLPGPQPLLSEPLDPARPGLLSEATPQPTTWPDYLMAPKSKGVSVPKSGVAFSRVASTAESSLEKCFR